MPPDNMLTLEGLYPEIDFTGGPAASVERLASSFGLSLRGLANCVGGVKLTASRGFATILLGADQRVFLVGIYEPGLEWASGSTTDLASALSAVAAWQEGAGVEDFVADYPFMIPGELALAHERGNVAEAQWENLLTSDYPSSCLPLLAELHAYDVMRKLFPDISYGEIRFTSPPPPQGARVIFVRGDGAEYRLREVGAEPRELRMSSLDEVVSYVSEYIGAD